MSKEIELHNFIVELKQRMALDKRFSYRVCMNMRDLINEIMSGNSKAYLKSKRALNNLKERGK